MCCGSSLKLKPGMTTMTMMMRRRRRRRKRRRGKRMQLHPCQKVTGALEVLVLWRSLAMCQAARKAVLCTGMSSPPAAMLTPLAIRAGTHRRKLWGAARRTIPELLALPEIMC
jgi:hypothetical protein